MVNFSKPNYKRNPFYDEFADENYNTKADLATEIFKKKYQTYIDTTAPITTEINYTDYKAFDYKAFEYKYNQYSAELLEKYYQYYFQKPTENQNYELYRDFISAKQKYDYYAPEEKHEEIKRLEDKIKEQEKNSVFVIQMHTDYKYNEITNIKRYAYDTVEDAKDKINELQKKYWYYYSIYEVDFDEFDKIGKFIIEPVLSYIRVIPF